MDSQKRHPGAHLLPLSSVEQWIYDLEAGVANGQGARSLDRLREALVNARSISIEGRVVWMLEEFHLVQNLVYAFNALARRGLSDERTNEFFTSAFKLLREWMVRSVRVRTHLLQGRVLHNSILPYCWVGGFDAEATASLVGVLMVFYDQERGNFFRRSTTVEFEHTMKCLLAAVYGDHIDVVSFYNQIEGVVGRGERRAKKAEHIMQLFAGHCWMHLEKRAQELYACKNALKYVTARRDSSWQNVMRKQFSAIIECDEKVGKQHATEQALWKVAYMIGKSTEGGCVSEPPVRKRAKREGESDNSSSCHNEKKEVARGLGFGAMVVRRIYGFASQNFDI